MENLLKETIEDLKANGKTPKDVLWIGTSKHAFTWHDFETVAKLADYDSGFGSQKVASDLMVVGPDFYMDRHEYDGSERWDYHSVPKKPDAWIKPKALTVNQAEENGLDVSCGWEDLATINGLSRLKSVKEDKQQGS